MMMKRSRWIGLISVLVFLTITVSFQSLRTDTSDNNRLHMIKPETEDKRTSTSSNNDVSEHFKGLPRCPSLLQKVPVNILQQSEDDLWQKVHHNYSYVYSAFTDPRITDGTLIRVIGFSKGIPHVPLRLRHEPHQYKTTLQCLLWLPDTKDALVFPAVQDLLFCGGFCTALFKSCAYICHIPIHSHNFPLGTRISISEENCTVPSNMMQLHINERPKAEYKEKFHSCLGGPISRNYGNINNFREWLSIQSIFGAESFSVYDYDAAKNLQNELQPYIDNQSIDYHAWNLQSIWNHSQIVGTTLWYFGQLAVLNDCLYRNMYKAEYIVCGDFDERIVPRCKGCNNWSDMIKFIIKHQCPTEQFYAFCSTLFGPDMEKLKEFFDTATLSNISDIRALTGILRNDFEPYDRRSKYIVNPRAIQYLDIHTLHLPYGTKSVQETLCVVDPDIGAVHHYKGNIRRDNSEPHVDLTMLGFKEAIQYEMQLRRTNASSKHTI